METLHSTAPHAKLPLLSMVLLVAYLLVEFLPVSLTEVTDNNGAHWLYVACINLLCLLALYLKKPADTQAPRDPFTGTYLLFCGWAALSAVLAFNQVEGLVAFSRLSVTFTAFYCMGQLLRHHPRLPRLLVLLLIISGGLQGVWVAAHFFAGQHPDLTNFDLGNKNIVSAAMVLKLGLAWFAVAGTTGWLRRGVWLSVACMSAAIYALLSRSGMIGTGLVMGMFIVISVSLRERRLLLRPMAITVAIAVTAMAAVEVYSRASQTTEEAQVVSSQVFTFKAKTAGSAASFRLGLWRNAASFALQHPLLGGGLGNWKIHTLPYDKSLTEDVYISKHAHNDFVELAADTGLPGALCYLAIFGLCGWGLVHVLRASPTSAGRLWLAAPAAGMLAYAVDASFNFPLERAGGQVLFAALLALNRHSYLSCFPVAPQPTKPRTVLLVLLLLGVGGAYVSTQVYQSMHAQWVLREEIEGTVDPTRQHTYEEVAAMLPAIPNITEQCIPIAHVKAKYLIEANRLDEALEIMPDGHRANPYMPFGDYMLGVLYQKKGMPDSGYAYLKRAHALRPRAATYYNAVQQAAANAKDLPTLEAYFAAYKEWHPVPGTYTDMAQWVLEATGQPSRALQYLAEARQQFPTDTEVAFSTHYITAYGHNMAGNYGQSVAEGLAALQVRATYPVLQNLALAYFGVGDYAHAIQYFGRVIDEYGYPTGEAQYLRGQCYLAMGDKTRACADFATAMERKYPVEPELIAQCH